MGDEPEVPTHAAVLRWVAWDIGQKPGFDDHVELLGNVADLVDLVERAAARAAKWKAVAEDLTDRDPCSYDHHGYCQTHFWLQDDRPCPHARAKALVAEAWQEPTEDRQEGLG